MMSDDTFWILMVGFALLALYGALVRGVTILVMPARERLVDLAARLVESDRISDEDKEDIECELERNFSAVDAWWAALYVVPAVLRIAFRRLSGQPTVRSEKFEDPELREFWTLALFTSLSNSPLALILFTMQMAAVTIFAHYRTMVRQLLLMMGPTHHKAHVRKLAA